ncbi:hypothetical protein BO70DRAFT_100405 [Aspergillus heteromorphus CBS 117.55]|uniref:Uncharacterized protein n=1 Tax=Aspergillus heteromorphus CBS 117.55 TaxID=1448321 RepID=A0A317VKZ2_9EURO|nr:uncharacterized protein BO70DRAFT_100405 [Aspergillus heteromorphus CBS 117.55]PWY75044.1 hypothetical protein BO70DRAFT_100405 [Aspergillus heteromorphus CBS 117.55]
MIACKKCLFQQAIRRHDLLLSLKHRQQTPDGLTTQCPFRPSATTMRVHARTAHGPSVGRFWRNIGNRMQGVKLIVNGSGLWRRNEWAYDWAADKTRVCVEGDATKGLAGMTSHGGFRTFYRMRQKLSPFEVMKAHRGTFAFREPWVSLA